MTSIWVESAKTGSTIPRSYKFFQITQIKYNPLHHHFLWRIVPFCSLIIDNHLSIHQPHATHISGRIRKFCHKSPKVWSVLYFTTLISVYFKINNVLRVFQSCCRNCRRLPRRWVYRWSSSLMMGVSVNPWQMTLTPNITITHQFYNRSIGSHPSPLQRRHSRSLGPDSIFRRCYKENVDGAIESLEARFHGRLCGINLVIRQCLRS